HETWAVDLDGDGATDIIGANWSGPYQPVEWWRNTKKLPLDKWTYIQVDSTRGKWGDFAQPDWLRYLGLDASDIDHDGYPNIISGRYFYRNPGGDMTGHWNRVDLGMNVDAMLFADVDGDKFADCITEAFPDVYWLEAGDTERKSWKATRVASLPATKHINGQGYALAQIIPGGRPEIVLSTGKGIYYLEIPDNPSGGNWPAVQIAPEATEQGLATGDIDGDGLVDITASYGPGVESEQVAWWKNPGNKSARWNLNKVGKTENYGVDRLAVSDVNADGRADLVVTEESWQTQDTVAHLFIFNQEGTVTTPSWKRKSILTSGSLNSLDVADIDHDGDMDIVTGEHKGKAKRIFVLENDGKGKFLTHVIDHSNKESHLGTLLFDMDSDGDLDILSIAWDDYRYLHLWRNDAIRK
ncbi:MAG: VCBS repeat-containing protein, partial [Bacteroidales bacterium]|nr:VCBS repeat-containing protein [Bacteroidales bacterium]